MTRDFHREPFDEGTLVKLALFRDYITAWLPVWLSKARPTTPITIVDFFAGPGLDEHGKPGSPLIAVEELHRFDKLIREKDAKVRLLLNECSERKAEKLRAALASRKIPAELCAYEVYDLDFADAFHLLLPQLRGGPNLLILDQQGMKQVSDDTFKEILALSVTDFVFFIASSSIRRFESHPYFQKHLKIPKGKVTSAAFNDTHRVVTEYYQSLASKEVGEYYVGRFSIKKGSNIYGLIFGSRHPLGLEKFLGACWKADPERGEANFDIDGDHIDPSAPRLFPEMDSPQKTKIFHDSLRRKILDGELLTDGDVYLESLRQGFLPAEGRRVLRTLVGERVRVIGGQARVSKEGFKDPRRLEVL